MKRLLIAVVAVGAFSLAASTASAEHARAPQRSGCYAPTYRAYTPRYSYAPSYRATSPYYQTYRYSNPYRYQSSPYRSSYYRSSIGVYGPSYSFRIGF